MKHLYIFEDGTASVHNDPTPEDLRCVEEGILQIFRFVPGSLRGEIQQCIPSSERMFEPVPPAKLDSDNGNNLYHTP